MINNSFTKWSKDTIQEIYTNVKQFSLTRKLQSSIDILKHENKVQEFELHKIKREYELYDLRSKGLLTVEQKLLHQQTHKDRLYLALADEIKRLQTVITTQNEALQKTPFITSTIVQVQKPSMLKTTNPLEFTKRLWRYRKNVSDYNNHINSANAVEFHIPIETNSDGISIERNGTRRYKNEYIQEGDRYIRTGNTFKTTYYLADIPAYLSPYILFRLLNAALPFTISTFIEPAPSAQLLKKARQRLSVLEMQQNERLKQGKLRDQQVDKHMEEVMSFIEELVHEQEKGFVYSFYLQLEASTEKELQEISQKLQNLTQAMDLALYHYTFAQKNAFKNFFPFNRDIIKENRILQTTAVSYLMPYVSKQSYDPDGIFLGVNAFSNSLVSINPFTARNNNINIFGVSGSGKSVTAKVLMNRLFMRGVQIIVIDPEGEYTNLAQELNGEVIQFSRENGINPFYISSTAENDILDHISTLKTFFKFFIQSVHYNSAILDRTLIALYDNGAPTFESLLELLGTNPMAEDLRVLSTGSLRGVFNATRRLELTNNMIVLDLHDLKKDEKREPAMYLLTSLIWNLVNKHTNKKRMIFIDEAHKLLIDPEVAVFYRELVKQARKRNVGVVSITQDVEDFLYSIYGKAIITNSETKILLKQSYATLSQIGTIYPMTDEEKQQLGHLDIGEVVLFREAEHIRLNMTVLPSEQPLVFGSQSE